MFSSEFNNINLYKDVFSLQYADLISIAFDI